MLRARAVTFLVLAAIAGFSTSTAHAVDKATRWYSVNVQPATDASPRLFLSNGSNGVTLERYRSGDPTQMWAPVQSDYPRSPDVEGSGGLDLLECGLWGCPFEGHGGAIVRFVNRASGGCLTIGSNGAYSAPCTNGDRRAELQKWQLNDTPDTMRGSYSPIILSGEATCLSASAKDGEAVAGGVVQPQGCGNHWSQKFTMLVSAEIACSPLLYSTLCFVTGQN